MTDYHRCILEKLRTFRSLLFFIGLLLININSPLFSAAPPILSIKTSSQVIVGDELTISIEALNSLGQLVNDPRELSLIIFNTDTSQTKSIRLTNGKTEEKVTLEKVGASLIEVVDPQDPTFIQYKPLDVLDRPSVKKL